MHSNRVFHRVYAQSGWSVLMFTCLSFNLNGYDIAFVLAKN